jgi:hypothetical protein
MPPLGALSRSRRRPNSSSSSTTGSPATTTNSTHPCAATSATPPTTSTGSRPISPGSPSCSAATPTANSSSHQPPRDRTSHDQLDKDYLHNADERASSRRAPFLGWPRSGPVACSAAVQEAGDPQPGMEAISADPTRAAATSVHTDRSGRSVPASPAVLRSMFGFELVGRSDATPKIDYITPAAIIAEAIAALPAHR